MSHNNVLFVLLVVCWLCSTGESAVAAPKRQLRSHMTGGYKNSQTKNSASELDCSQFTNDYDILRQLPFPILINPIEDPFNESVATMDESNTFVNMIHIQHEDIFPLSVFCLTNLIELSIEATPFPNNIVPDALGKLKQLKLFWVFNIPIVKMTDQLVTLENLDNLMLQNCSLTHMPNLSNLTQLAQLVICDNSLSQLDGLMNVRWLDLGDNLFNEIPIIQNRDNVTGIFMYNNPLRNAIRATSYINLKHLSLSNTTLSSIPRDIDKLQRLEYLSLSNNKLSSIPPNIHNLSHLQNLGIRNNLLSPDNIQSFQKEFEKSHPNAQLYI